MHFTGKNTSVWMDTSPSTSYPALKHDLDAEVVVIGGGITGLMTAYFIQKAGLRVTILEGARIAAGTTGYTTAKITSAHALIYEYLIDHFGRDRAQIYADANQQALETMANLVSEYNIDCDFMRSDAYTYVLSPDGDQEIEAEVDAARSLGLPVSFTRDQALPYRISSAIRYDNQARFHPRKFLLKIAALLVDNGGQIFEQTPVTDIREGSPCQIITAKGMVAAKTIVVATNQPVYDPNGFYTRMTSHQSYTIGVKVDGPLPEGVFYGPENNAYHSFRTQPLSVDDDLLMIGGKVRLGAVPDYNEKQYQLLEEWAQKFFPVRSLEYRWTTSDSESGDRVPMIGKIAPQSPNVWVATGFSGWGMTHGTVAGLILASEVKGKSHPWSNLYSPERFPAFSEVPDSTAPNRGPGDKSKLEDVFAGLKPGNGQVKSVAGNKVAAMRDQQGVLHAVSAVCTHMGCIVAWNKKKQTWDCPCHDSRYDREGKVIHGPAVKDLPADIL